MASMLNKYIAEFDELWSNSDNILDQQSLDVELADIQLTMTTTLFGLKFKMWDATENNNE